MYNIQFTEKAIKDMEEIKNYIEIELCNQKAATNVLKNIIDKIKRLSSFPLMGASLSSIISINTDYRYLVCGNYLTFYRVVDTNIYIDRILYGQRNYMQALFGEPKDN